MSALLAAHTFELSRHLSRHQQSFDDECMRLPASWFVPYPDTHLYDQGWLIGLVLLRWAEVPQFLQIDRIQRACPATAAALSCRPDVLVGGFSRLLPGCHVAEHVDRPKAGVLRWLSVLRDHGGAVFTTATGSRPLRRGECFVFDHSLGHAAANEGPGSCDFLVVDFEVPAPEAELLRRTRGGVNLGPTSLDAPPSST